MPIKHNAASKAVQAKPCLKAPDTNALPTLRQTMLMALAIVQKSLEDLVDIRRKDEAWDDDDVDVDYAVGLALAHIKSLRANPPAGRNQFDHAWFMAAAAINLSVRVFSRTDCYYYRSLSGAKKRFEVLVAAVEFAEGRA